MTGFPDDPDIRLSSHAKSVVESPPVPWRVTLLVLPGSSMMTVASTLEPLRALNRLSNCEQVSWRLVTLDGLPVLLSCGLPLAGQGALVPDLAGDLLVVVAGFDAMSHVPRQGLTTLHRCNARFGTVAGIESGAWVLGALGWLDERQATTHWEDLEDFAASHLTTDVRSDRWVIDGRVITAGGASPVSDLMLHLIRDRFGPASAIDVASVFIYDETKAASEPQPVISLGRLKEREPRVALAVEVMSRTLDRPLSTVAIARQVRISVRRLETLFQETLGSSPAAYYMRLRISAARRLVVETALPLNEAALRSGFGSVSSFSHSFRQHTGMTAGAARRAVRLHRSI